MGRSLLGGFYGKRCGRRGEQASEGPNHPRDSGEQGRPWLFSIWLGLGRLGVWALDWSVSLKRQDPSQGRRVTRRRMQSDRD